MTRNYLDFPLSIQRSDRLRSLNQREAFWISKLWATKYPAINKDLDDIIASSKANKGYKKEFKLMFDAAIYSPCGVEGARPGFEDLSYWYSFTGRIFHSHLGGRLSVFMD